MADHIRNSDEALLKACDKSGFHKPVKQSLLKSYQNDVLPAESFGEFFDVAGLLSDVQNPDAFISEALDSLPK
ncbi:E3 ubiquitin-protein ligase UBR4 [Exaiptasia diaphana]|nr:E3 ubiquitin-protein ligase UBR4 [Exaiptasia diaphana]